MLDNIQNLSLQEREAILNELKKSQDLDSMGEIDAIKYRIENDEKLKGAFAFNTLKNQMYVLKPLPWNNQYDRPFTDKDLSQLKAYVQSNKTLYKDLRVHKDDFKTALDIVFDNNRYDPFERYLDSLTWDGEERLKKVISYVFDQEYDAFYGEIMILWFKAAIARTYEPGTKFDIMPVLIGRQGCGKDTFIRKLSPDASYVLEDFRFNNESRKMTESILSYKIIVASELAGAKRTEMEGIKSFLTKTCLDDVLKYDKYPDHRPAKHVFIGTTNEKHFIKDSSGARRFLPIPLDCKNAYTMAERVNKVMTPEYRDQLWAEAMELYKNDKTLYLNRIQSARALEEQDDIQVGNIFEEQINKYVDSRINEYLNDQTNTKSRCIQTNDIYKDIIATEFFNTSASSKKEIMADIVYVLQQRELRIGDIKDTRLYDTDEVRKKGFFIIKKKL